MTIICDNMMIFNNQIECIVWDDTNEMFYAFRANNSQYSQDAAPAEMVSTEYEHIQYINGYFNTEDGGLDAMLAITPASDSQKEFLKKYIGSMINFNPDNTNEGFPKDHPMQKDWTNYDGKSVVNNSAVKIATGDLDAFTDRTAKDKNKDTPTT